MTQVRLPFARAGSPAGSYGDFLSDLLAGSNLRPDLLSLFYSTVAHTFFDRVSQNFVVKSAGGADEDGVRWADIAPETKAYNRKNLRIGLAMPGPKKRPLLTPQADRYWRRVFMQHVNEDPDDPLTRFYRRSKQRAFGFLVEINVERAAESRAASIAWKKTKERFGELTLLAALGDRKVKLLMDSGRLALSYAPSSISPQSVYTPRTDQLYRPGLSYLLVGSTVPYADKMDSQRPILPPEGSSIGNDCVEAGLKAVYDRVQQER